MIHKSALLWIALLAIVMVSTLSCDEPPKKDEDNFQENLSSFNNKMTKLDSTLDLMDKLQENVDKIEEDRAKGTITDEEALEKLNNINNTLGRKIAKTSNSHKLKGIPVWAHQLGLTEPEGMQLDSDFSQSTSEQNEIEGFNSVSMVYQGDYNTAMKQAAIIAAKAEIPTSQDYKDAIELSEKYGIESIKGASYLNFEIGSLDNPQYNISITVDENGTLTINATDTQAMIEQLSK